MRQGTYFRTGPFELTSADSGDEGGPVVCRAQPEREVRLSGGRLVTDWQRVTDPIVLECLDESVRGQVLQADLKALGLADFGSPLSGEAELVFQDRPMTLVRWPNDRFTCLTGVSGEEPIEVHSAKGDKVGKIFYDNPRVSRWVDAKSPCAHGAWFWDWSDQRHRIKSVDAATGLSTLEEPYHHYGYRVGQWFYVYNILAELDAEGEWYLDRDTGIRYFWPPRPIDEGDAVVCGTRTAMNIEKLNLENLLKS